MIAALAYSMSSMMGSDSIRVFISVSACCMSPMANCCRMLLSPRAVMTAPTTRIKVIAVDETRYTRKNINSSMNQFCPFCLSAACFMCGGKVGK